MENARDYLNLGVVAAYSTVIIEDVKTIPADCQLKPHITLIFMGGMLDATQEIFITGNNTTIVAPRRQIFDEKISVNGSWNINEAYPEWFGAVTYETQSESSANGHINSSDAINKAIVMKHTGKVTFGRGFYVIDKPIDVPCGISLIGTLGTNNDYGDVPAESRADDKRASGTAFSLDSTLRTSNDYQYVIGINLKDINGSLDWDWHHTMLVTSIENIVFWNFHSITIENPIPPCILIGGAANLSRLAFREIPKVVKTLDNVVTDGLNISNCIYEYFLSLNINGFAFDLSNVGTSLNFTHNLIHNGVSKIKALLLSGCSGAIISDNVINSDVEFRNSHALFSANHMEYGSQIRIFTSQVCLSDNYIERGARPALLILADQYANVSTVDSNNNVFVLFGIDRIEANIAKNRKPHPEIYCTFNDYDIVIDNICSLSISSTYRTSKISEAVTNKPTGTMLGIINSNSQSYSENDIITSFDEFNSDSYALSLNSNIVKGKILNKNFDVPNVKEDGLVNVGNAQDSIKTWWIAQTGYYYYAYEVIWDLSRRIIMTKDNDNKFLFPLNNDNNADVNNTNYRLIGLYRTQYQKTCTTINILQKLCLPIRLYRKRSDSAELNPTSYDEYVDIPLICCNQLFDNGYDVSGYRWKPMNGSNIPTPINTNLREMHKVGINVNSTAGSLNNNYPGWTSGDRISKIGSTQTKIIR